MTGAGAFSYFIVWLAAGQIDMGRTGETILFLIPYVILSVSTYWELLKKIVKLHFLDESFLMVIATAGAFFVGRYKEAVAAMLFYQAGKLIEEISLSRTKKSISPWNNTSTSSAHFLYPFRSPNHLGYSPRCDQQSTQRKPRDRERISYPPLSIVTKQLKRSWTLWKTLQVSWSE